MSLHLRRATRTASTIGRVIGFLFIFGGVWLVFLGNWLNGIWLAFIGWFLQNAAVGSYRQLALRDMLQGHKVSELMTRECLMIIPEMTIEQLVNENILASGRRCFPVVEKGKALGLVTIHNIRTVPRDQWPARTVKDAMTPFDKLKWVRPDQDLSTVLEILTESDINQVPVVEDNNVVGMIARDSLLNFVSVRGELGM